MFQNFSIRYGVRVIHNLLLIIAYIYSLTWSTSVTKNCLVDFISKTQSASILGLNYSWFSHVSSILRKLFTILITDYAEVVREKVKVMNLQWHVMFYCLVFCEFLASLFSKLFVNKWGMSGPFFLSLMGFSFSFCCPTHGKNTLLCVSKLQAEKSTVTFRLPKTVHLCFSHWIFSFMFSYSSWANT